MELRIRKCVYFVYQVSSIHKLLTLFGFITDNFGGIKYTDTEGMLMFSHFASFSHRLCKLSSQNNDIQKKKKKKKKKKKNNKQT